MSDTLYLLYRDKVMRLAKTIVVKLDEIARTINLTVRDNALEVNWDLPSTWKYYLNLAGIYHALDRRQVLAMNTAAGVVDNLPVGVSPDLMLIKVASNDGPVFINFTSATIDSAFGGDVALANEYAYGSSSYKELVTRYPGMEELILGILYRTDLSVSVSAPDGAILYCGGYYRQVTDNKVSYLPQSDDGRDVSELLVESNERSLIEAIQRFIDGYRFRWHNPDYGTLDDLYYAAVYGIMYLQIPMVVMNHRLERCLTNEAHSYHVQEFLESHGQLAKYIPAIPLAQTLWLYRNVRYIERNIGTQHTFDLLIDNLLTPAGVPIAGYAVRHNLSQQPENLLPTPDAVRETINFDMAGNGADVKTIPELVYKEVGLARANGDNLDEVIPTMEQTIIRGRSNLYQTKVLESAMVDSADTLPFPVSGFLVNFWLFTASIGRYNGNIFVTNPVTGQRIALTPLNAFTLAVYATMRAASPEIPIHIPTVVARNIPLALSSDLPSVATYMQRVVSSPVITQADLITLAQASMVPVVSSLGITSTAKFYAVAKRYHQRLLRQYTQVQQVEDYVARAELEFALSQLYALQTSCTLTTIPTFDEWFLHNGISVAEIEASESPERNYQLLALELIRQGTGNVIDSAKRLGEMQAALMGVMQQFSSYGVQYVYSIKERPTVVMDVKTLRLSTPRNKMHASNKLRLPVLGVSEPSFRMRGTPISVSGGFTYTVT